MSLIRRFCDRAILIEDGKIAYEGDAESVADEYNELFSMNSDTAKKPDGGSYVEMLKHTGKVVKDKIHLNLKLRSGKTIKDLILVVRILNEGRTVAGVTSEHLGLNKGLELKQGVDAEIQIVLNNTVRLRNFYVSFTLRTKDASVRYGHWDRVLQIENNTEPSKLPVLMSGDIKIKH
jgi:ABC-type multidrug transport system ATPase subunit